MHFAWYHMGFTCETDELREIFQHALNHIIQMSTRSIDKIIKHRHYKNCVLWKMLFNADRN